MYDATRTDGRVQANGQKARRVSAIKKRLEISTFKLDPTHIDVRRLVNEIHRDVRTGVAAEHLDDLAIGAALRSAHINPSYIWLASHIEVAKMHKSLPPRFSDSVKALRDAPESLVLSKELLEVVEKHKDTLDNAIVHMNDYDHG
ncbi:hypothetical protein B0H17DRAFT_1205229 [Mycena rosella]|uniref:Uncharacterized protein n=1 Tax=Mycena rosella TaxID=1033263 RepID=A0AAD7D8A6_MYCRO|nr:hypothetical protein B0H17DRAFT_1205229 [Mycena rosella]